MDDRLEQLLARDQIIAVLTDLFVHTDTRNWDGVAGCLTERVFLDMTSLTGGEPFTLPAAEITDAWERAFRPLSAVHHQVGNFRVDLGDGEATASCYGIAYHHRQARAGHSTRTFVGSYDFHLRREDSGWKVDSFRFNCKFIDGRLDPDEDEAE
jgi:hypothetical protein